MEALIHPILQTKSAVFFIDYGQDIPSFYSTMSRYKTMTIESYRKENDQICYLFTGDIICEDSEPEFLVSFDVATSTHLKFDSLREDNNGDWVLLVVSSTAIVIEVNSRHQITQIQEHPRSDFF